MIEIKEKKKSNKDERVSKQVKKEESRIIEIEKKCKVFVEVLEWFKSCTL